MQHLSQSLAALTLASASALAVAQTTFSASVKNAYVAGVLSVAADATDANLVVVGSARQRMTGEVGESSAAALLAELGKAAGLVPQQVEGINVLSPRLCERPAEGAMPPLPSVPVTFNFQAVSPAVLLAVLADFSSLRYADVAARPPGEPEYLITVRLKHVPAAVAYRVLYAATGARLLPQPDGSYRIDEAPRAPCGALPAPKVASDQAPPRSPDQGPRKLRDAVRGLPSSPPCDPLEHFALDDIVLRGRITRAARPIPLLEAPNGLSYGARPGDYLGHDFGRLMAVDSAGLTLREMRLDSLNFYRERWVRIDWNNTRMSVEKNAP